MFSEAIHSLADTCNQVRFVSFIKNFIFTSYFNSSVELSLLQALLALGISQSIRNPDAGHP